MSAEIDIDRPPVLLDQLRYRVLRWWKSVPTHRETSGGTHSGFAGCVPPYRFPSWPWRLSLLDGLAPQVQVNPLPTRQHGYPGRPAARRPGRDSSPRTESLASVDIHRPGYGLVTIGGRIDGDKVVAQSKRLQQASGPAPIAPLPRQTDDRRAHAQRPTDRLQTRGC